MTPYTNLVKLNGMFFGRSGYCQRKGQCTHKGWNTEHRVSDVTWKSEDGKRSSRLTLHCRVTVGTNLLLLSDGPLVCSNCSYNAASATSPSLMMPSWPVMIYIMPTASNAIPVTTVLTNSYSPRLAMIFIAFHATNKHVACSRRHVQKQKKCKNTPLTGDPSNSHDVPTTKQWLLNPVAHGRQIWKYQGCVHAARAWHKCGHCPHCMGCVTLAYLHQVCHVLIFSS